MASHCHCQDKYKVETLCHTTAVIGEGPHWDISTQSLYFVDIKSAIVYRYDYNEDKVYEAKVDNANHLSFIIPIENKPNQFAVGIDRRVCIIEWDGKSKKSDITSVLFEVESNDEKRKDNRFNDAKIDPKGRFYGGTMPIFVPDDHLQTERTGNFYRYDNDKKEVILLKDNVAISNGLTWNIKTNKFYYIDTVDIEVKEYDYNIETGDIKNPKVLIDFRVKKGEEQTFFPDGMTIDTNGYLYVAILGGSKIVKINPSNGKIDMEIKLPCEKITSAAFGGPNLDILFVTSIATATELSGKTFKVTGLDVKGLPMNKLIL